MSTPLIPIELLNKSNKILFIAHLALGDYTYLQNFFAAFAKKFPHLKIDLWVDEVRRTKDATKWTSLKKYSLYDWVNACPFFNYVYQETYSPELLEQSIRQAKKEQYPIVISLATLRPQFYADLARKISVNGFVVGMKKKVGLLQLHHHFAYYKLDAVIPAYKNKKPHHITDEYNAWFEAIAGVSLPLKERFPFIDIPFEWMEYATHQFKQWHIDEEQDQIVFINAIAKTKKRCWPLEKVVELIKAMKQMDKWKNSHFIVNTIPSELENTHKLLISHELKNVIVFSATENFFQLPAVLEKCTLVISVETAVMHLANAVHVPVIALMRLKTPEWVPIDSANSKVITTDKRKNWIKEIPVESVIHALEFAST